ncbi:MAG: maleylpyruvate isomerase N-terminal domain-containing protein [Mycolicibacterium neoaurum]|uniref:maleylpyruvate isomerase family mycothiol-dependent enzyme n=1 Tax=Mycolicibacterium neoaurum TaxID=1795 RepID=UPI002FF9430F
MTGLDPSVTVFGSAARSFEQLVRRLGATDWDGPGLGDWNLRSLVGHTSRSLVTVIEYLKQPAPTGELVDAPGYYLAVREFGVAAGAEAIIERGRQAGRDLGDDPAAAVSALVATALSDVEQAGDPAIAVIGGMGIRLSEYLQTRIFELVVHGLDIARATGFDHQPSEQMLEAANVLAARIATRSGRGAPLLLGLTGRAELGDDFSVV